MVSKLPDWLIEYLEDNTGFKRPVYFGYPYYTTTQQSDAVVAFYEFISKPENAAKIPEVAKLIEGLKEYADESRWEEFTLYGDGIFDFKDGDCCQAFNDGGSGDGSSIAREALAPFKGGE